MNTRTPAFAGVPVATSKPATGERFKAIARAVWDALLVAGERRGRREILSLAASVEATRPALAAQLREAAENRWN